MDSSESQKRTSNKNNQSQKDSQSGSQPAKSRRRRSSSKKKQIERVALFIDGINLWYAQQKLNYRIDYVKLRDCWSKEEHRRLYNAFFYTGHHATPEDEKQQFLDLLINNGYTLRTKTVKTMYDPMQKKDVYKCNLDVEIVIDMLTTLDQYDTAVLISGDGDFERAVEVLRSRGKTVYGVCCRAMTAKDLVSAVDRFYWLEDMKSELEYKGGGSQQSRSGGRSERGEPRQNPFTEMKI